MNTHADSSGLWRALLEIARFTPSPHNTQPWFLEVHSATTARLLLNHDRALPKEDLTGCFISCAMGSFLESLRLLAANRHHRLEATLLDEPRDGAFEPFADLQLVRDDTLHSDVDDDLFLRRQTSRLAPEAGTLSADELVHLQAIASRFGQQLLHFTDRAVIDHLMQFNLDAVIHDLNSSDYHDEIVSWFRFRERTALARRDGLSALCMTIPAIEFWFLARFPQSAMLPIVGSIVRRMYARRLGPVPQLAALAGTFWDRKSAVNAGAGLMRLWLEMTRFGLYIHPFGNLVTNDTARAGLNKITSTDKIWIVFRIGRTSPPPRSHRLAVGDISNA